MNVISHPPDSSSITHNSPFSEQSHTPCALLRRFHPADQLIVPETLERRAHRRFKVAEGVLAVCTHYAGKVIDLSKSGISFIIVHHNDKTLSSGQHKPFRPDDIAILPSVANGFLLSDLKVEKIIDHDIGFYQGNSSITLYRRCIEFADRLSAEQFNLLMPLLVPAGKKERYKTHSAENSR